MTITAPLPTTATPEILEGPEKQPLLGLSPHASSHSAVTSSWASEWLSQRQSEDKGRSLLHIMGTLPYYIDLDPWHSQGVAEDLQTVKRPPYLPSSLLRPLPQHCENGQENIEQHRLGSDGAVIRVGSSRLSSLVSELEPA